MPSALTFMLEGEGGKKVEDKKVLCGLMSSEKGLRQRKQVETADNLDACPWKHEGIGEAGWGGACTVCRDLHTVM